MKITIWGCRGSIPVPGPSTVKYGGNTTCVEVSLGDGTTIILDAGSGIRNLGKKIVEEGKTQDLYLMLTHSHWDHLIGFPFFSPAYREGFKIHVRGGPIAKETVRNYLERQMEPPYFPARFSAMKADFDFTHGIPMVKQIGSATVTPIPLSHPNGGYGYKITDGGKTFVFLTDNELDYQHEAGGCEGGGQAFRPLPPRPGTRGFRNGRPHKQASGTARTKGYEHASLRGKRGEGDRALSGRTSLKARNRTGCSVTR